MDELRDEGSVPPRVPTGIAGLDEVLSGGLFRAGVYIVRGVPGVGKTVLGNQLAFHHVRSGGRAVYATLLSESHGRLLAFMQAMSFFDRGAVGKTIQYLNGYSAIEREGLPGLLKLIRGIVRDGKATLLVIDGMITASAVAGSEIEFKKFVQELQTWIEIIGCTVVLLTSARESELRPEYTMVDGIIELEYPAIGARRVRELTVTKFRGSAYAEGKHTYDITRDGVSVFPRVESRFGRRPQAAVQDGRADLGDARLDAMVAGGFARGSATLLIGSSGAGKTILGLQFLAAGLARDERALHFGFYEDPPTTVASGDRFGFRFGDAVREGRLECVWLPMAEGVLDRIGDCLITSVERTRAHRVVVDGLQAFRNAAHAERLAGVWGALAQELRSRGVTMLIMAETPEMFVQRLEVPVPGMSAAVDNVVFLRQMEDGAKVRRELGVLKTRDRAHERSLVEYEITAHGIRLGRGYPSTSAAGARGRASPVKQGEGRGRGKR
ncbi:MAG TPA: ATPase domain-containing protein [Anaeromyxobacter sp.]|nr:ATPase domain-containing protein [Anaeromyxobacter sp.]